MTAQPPPPAGPPEAPAGSAASGPELLPDRLAAALSGKLPPPIDGRVLMSATEQLAARPAAVLVALVADGGQGVDILLTRRTEHLPKHGGQISFAGGGVDAADRDAVATALREAEEEIGLQPQLVRVLGVLPEFLVPTGFRVTPVLAWVNRPLLLRADPAEVAEIFFLPATVGLDPTAWHTEEIERSGRRRTLWAMDFEGRRIWGATAAILVWLGGLLRAQDIQF